MRKKGPRADLDRSVKALVRHYPRAFLRLAGLEIAGDVRFGDVSVNLPELRADQVLVVHH